MASPREGSGILYAGFLTEDTARSVASCSFSNSTLSSYPKIFQWQCQGHSFGQSRIITKSICLWIARSRLTDSWVSQGPPELCTLDIWIKTCLF